MALRKREMDLEGYHLDLEFEDPSVRRSFIRKVFLILTVQLLFTISIVSIFIFHEPLRMYVYQDTTLYWIALLAMFVLIILMICFESLRRSVPQNFIMLGIFTIVESILVGYVAAKTQPENILLALTLTTFIVFVLAIFAIQTTIDFTVCGAGLFICLLLLLVFSIVVLFIPSYTMVMIVNCCGALLIAIYLIYDIQLMMGGKYASISPEEYIFGALNLYLDIVLLFLYILGITEH